VIGGKTIFAKKELSDSIINISPLHPLIPDSLSFEPQAEIIDTLSFFGHDTLGQFDVSMPIHKISEIEYLMPPVENWLSYTFLGLLVYLIIVRILYSFSFSENLSALLKINSIDSVGFQKESFSPGYLLFPIAVFVFAFYLYFFINPQYLLFNVDYLFLLFSFLIVIIHFIKYVVERLISVIFNTQQMFKKYHYDQVYMLGVSSLIQLPLLAIFIYNGNKFFLWGSLLVLSTLWLVRLLRGFVIGFQETNFSRLYIILYLCSLEIIPLLIAYKWFIV